MKITRNADVEIHYELFSKGESLENTRNEEEPVSYRHGREEILPGLEKALEGHEPGDEIRITLSAPEAYGEYSPEGLVSVPVAEMQGEAKMKPGDWITVSVADPDHDEEGELEMRVVEIHPDEIILDANHPLAGKDVTFVVEVISVNPSKG